MLSDCYSNFLFESNKLTNINQLKVGALHEF